MTPAKPPTAEQRQAFDPAYAALKDADYRLLIRVAVRYVLAGRRTAKVDEIIDDIDGVLDIALGVRPRELFVSPCANCKTPGQCKTTEHCK